MLGTNEVAPGLEEIIVNADENLESIELISGTVFQGDPVIRAEATVLVQATRFENYNLKRILLQRGQSIVGIYGKMTPQKQLIWFSFIVCHPLKCWS